MKKILSMTPLAALAAVALILATGAHDNGRLRFRAKLSGENEVPPVETMTTGQAVIEFHRDFEYATFKLDVKRGERITQAHIHCGPEGMNGPVVVFLAGFHDRGWDVDGQFVRAKFTAANITNTTCGTTLEELAMAMEDGGTYVNVHSVAHPPGVVRGQLERVGGGHDDDD
jgi:hypothetical protein